jgi:hypothetical protein
MPATLKLTEHYGQVVGTLASYLGGPGDKLGCFPWLSSVPPDECQDSALNEATATSFHILSNSLQINHPIIQHYTV